MTPLKREGLDTFELKMKSFDVDVCGANKHKIGKYNAMRFPMAMPKRPNQNSPISNRIPKTEVQYIPMSVAEKAKSKQKQSKIFPAGCHNRLASLQHSPDMLASV